MNTIPVFTRSVLSLLFIVVGMLAAQAQTLSKADLAAMEYAKDWSEPVLVAEPPLFGSFISASGKFPPTPINIFPTLDLYSVGNNIYVYDDRDFDRKTLLESFSPQMSMLSGPPGLGESGSGSGGGDEGGLLLLVDEPVHLVEAAQNCLTNGAVYMTNISYSFSTNIGWQFCFDIMGENDSEPLDIFAAAELTGNDVTNMVWTWLGAGNVCERHCFAGLETERLFWC